MSIGWRELAYLGALLLLAAPAFAAFQADFFSTDGQPRLTRDGDADTWTIENRGIRRVVRFDRDRGGLVPVALDNLRTDTPSGARISSEGLLTLEAADAPMEEVPLEWHLSESEPAGDWSGPGGEGLGWKPVDLPFRTDEENRSWWFRTNVPQGGLSAGRDGALTFAQALDDGAEVFADGRSVAVADAASQPWNRVVSVRIPAGTRRIGVVLKGGGRPNGFLNARLTPAPEARSLSLDRGWTLRGHEFENGALSVRLRGVGDNAGFDLTAVYLLQPGDEPVAAKRFFLRNNTGKDQRLAEAVMDRLESTGNAPESKAYTGSGRAVSERGRGPGFAAAVFHWQGRCDVEGSGRGVTCRYAPNAVVKDGEVLRTPWSVVGLYDGPPETGAFLLQLCAGAHVSAATPETVPPLFSTWFGYYMDVDEALVRKLVPQAADLGVGVFSIDDGWQALGDDTTWGYGDWRENRAKFPGGLASIAELVRSHGMRFGLWSAPIMVNDNSTIIEKHPEWLVRQPDGSRKALWGKTSAMCFSGEYARLYTEALAKKAKELKLGFVKLDGSLFVDGCTAEGHGHPPGHSEAAQVRAWENLVAALRAASPGIIVDRGWEGEPGLTALQDTSWFGDWATAFHPEREADRRWWYRNADIYRKALFTLAANRPPFTLSWETPSHIPTDPPDLDALEYHFTSIGAYICNVEIHGRLLDSTPEERALVRKWVAWNRENRPWLAFAQPIDDLGEPYEALDEKSTPHVDGVLHLRNALRGRYGYACLWNPSEKPATARFTVRPSDYFVRMKPWEARVTRLKDGKPAGVRASEDALHFTVEMAPLSWEILEITRDTSAREAR